MHERGTFGAGLQIRYKRNMDRLIELSRGIQRNARPASQDPIARQRLAQCYAEIEIMRLNQMRAFSRLSATGVPGPEGSIQKIFWSELNQRFQQVAQELLGPYGQLVGRDGHAIDKGVWSYGYLRARGNTIEAGTSEIQRNIIGHFVLGLPRSYWGRRMQFGLSESQEILKDSARKFFAGECPISEVRRLMETETAYDPDLWWKLAEQGYTGIIFPEEYGGVGLGKVELILMMEEAGRALLPGPLFSTVALAGAVLDGVGTAEQKRKYLTPICRGEARSTLAMLEAAASWDPKDAQIEVLNGKLTGEKLFVPDALVADAIVVVARNGVFVVDATDSGIKTAAMPAMDLTRDRKST